MGGGSQWWRDVRGGKLGRKLTGNMLEHWQLLEGRGWLSLERGRRERRSLNLLGVK